MWNDIDKGFQIAFEMAWESFKIGTIPIGACIMNESNELVATGQNQIHAKGDGLISFHQLAHAEANAIMKVSEETVPNMHPNIRKYTLYTSMEPCPFCFGAIVMGSIKNVKFAARDRWAGATALNDSIGYIKKKNISVEGPFERIEIVQIAIQTYFEMQERSAVVLLDAWTEDCPVGVDIGKRMFESRALDKQIKENTAASVVYDYIFNYKLYE